MLISWPAKSDTKKAIRVTSPIKSPQHTSRADNPIQSSRVIGPWAKAGSVGATSTASKAAKATRTCTGTLSIVKIGRMLRNAPARMKTSIQLVRSQSMRLQCHFGYLQEDGRGELHQLADHPWRQ